MTKHEELKKLIIDHLMSKQYLEKDAQFVFNELPEIWKLMEENKLVPDGLTYAQFVAIARQQHLFAALKAQAGY